MSAERQALNALVAHRKAQRLHWSSGDMRPLAAALEAAADALIEEETATAAQMQDRLDAALDDFRARYGG